MTDAILAPAISWRAMLPAGVLAVTGCLLIVLDLLPPRDRKDHLGLVALIGVVLSVLLALPLWGREERAFGGMLVLDAYGLFSTLIIGYGVGLVLLLSLDYVRRQGEESGEFYILVVFAALGMVLMATGGDLMVIFLGLETMSISLYVLAGYFRGRAEAGEASMKYFLLGAFASAFFIYGTALIFGATGSTTLSRIATALAGGGSRDPMLLIGLGLLLVGFGFKISAVPFHMWASDVYQGAPTSITALIATASKAAAFAALLRVLITALRGAQPDWVILLWGLAALSMTLGNVVAIAQQDLKRMLAYSSIAHVGYMLVGVVAGGALGHGAVLFYLLVYTFTTAGTFGVLALLERRGQTSLEVSELTGLASRHPLVALALTIFLLSLIGIPPLAGFAGKFYLFGAAVRSGFVWLAVIGVLNSAIAAYYYLRIVVVMYMREPEARTASLAASFPGGLAVAVSLWGVVQLGVLPARLLDLAQAAVAPLLR